MHQKRLAAGLFPDPLGELTALLRPLAGFQSWGRDKVRRERIKDEQRKEEGVKGREGRRDGREGKQKGRSNLMPMVISTRSSAIAGRPCDAKACQG